MLQKILGISLFGLSILYPFVLGDQICLLLAIVWGIKAIIEIKKKQKFWAASLLIFAFFLIISINNKANFLLMLYPSLINIGLCFFFAWSLRHESMITHFAKIEHKIKKLPQLNPSEIAYTRLLTLIWSIIFLWNALFCTFLILINQQDLWALYSGIGGYVLAGVFFLVEKIFRNRFIKIFLAWRG